MFTKFDGSMIMMDKSEAWSALSPPRNFSKNGNSGISLLQENEHIQSPTARKGQLVDQLFKRTGLPIIWLSNTLNGINNRNWIQQKNGMPYICLQCENCIASNAFHRHPTMLIGADDAAAAIIEISGAGRGTEHNGVCHYWMQAVWLISNSLSLSLAPSNMRISSSIGNSLMFSWTMVNGSDCRTLLTNTTKYTTVGPLSPSPAPNKL